MPTLPFPFLIICVFLSAYQRDFFERRLLLPPFLLEVIHHSDAYASHYEQNHRIPPAPAKLRHVFKIHVIV